MHRDTVIDGGIYFGALFFTVIIIMLNGFSELAMTIMKLPVFYKQRDLLFFPVWAYSLPTWILKIPVTIVEVAIWVIMTYYVIGYDPYAGRLIKLQLFRISDFDPMIHILINSLLPGSSNSIFCYYVYIRWRLDYFDSLQH